MTELPIFELLYKKGAEKLVLVEKKLSSGGLSMDLNEREHSLMLLFMQSGGRVVLHEKIRRVLFNADVLNQTEKSDLSVTKTSLQVKLDALTDKHIDIRSKKRHGYRLVIR